MSLAAQDEPIAWQNLPVVRQAAQSILQAFGAWEQLPARIQAAESQVAIIRNAAMVQQNAGIVGAMLVVNRALTDLQSTFYATSPQVGQVVSTLSQPGVSPTIDVVTTAANVWATMQAALAGMDAQEAELRQDAPQVLSADQVTSLNIGSGSGTFLAGAGSGTIGTYLLFGVLGIAAIGLFGGKRRRKRAQ